MEKFPIYLEGNRLFSNSKKATDLQSIKKIGELKEGKVIFTIYEAFYLFESKKAEIIKNNKVLSENSLLKNFSKDKNFLTKYLVFKNLKDKGYIVKTGLKFGEEFRVYNKSDFQKNNHAKYICYPIKESEKINPKELIAKSRVAHGAGKKLLLAIVDSEEDISFYELDWMKP